MKSTKNQSNNKTKSRVVSFASMLALILCTVLSFVLIMPDRSVYAATEAEKTKSDNGIRFVQVAAGQDFAIGLTYNGDLYGWSLLDGESNGKGSGANTLGGYYTSVPTKIDVKFLVGPDSAGTNMWGNAKGQGYHAERKDDRIKSIAATRYTAAFVTENGYIYTWGKDSGEYLDVLQSNTMNDDHYLLLRVPDDSDKCNWYTPYIINYYYYNQTTGSHEEPREGGNWVWAASTTPLEQLIPEKEGGYSAIAAGEFNYVFMFSRRISTTNDWNINNAADAYYYYTFVWGSGLYNVPNLQTNLTEKQYSDSHLGFDKNSRRTFNTRILTSSSGTVTPVAGGYTVGFNYTEASTDNDTSLSLHGRNFITTQPVSGTTIIHTTALSTATADNSISIKDTASGTAFAGAIAGGRDESGATPLGNLYGKNKEMYYARQAGKLTGSGSNTAGLKYSTTETANIILANSELDFTPRTATRYAVSLGNDIGYGLVEGVLYGWGDNANGQLVGYTNEEHSGYSENPTQLIPGVNNFVSVVAGKQKSSNNKAFFSGVTTLSGNNFEERVKNDPAYISAALTREGYIYAWSNTISTAQKLAFLNVDGASREKFSAVYSGYGEYLFAVTENGKLVCITVTDGQFVQDVYDTFGEVTEVTASATNIKQYTNWTVVSTNKLVFATADKATAAKPNPDFTTATIYLWSMNGGAGITVNNGKTGETSEFVPLISANNIGGAYRILRNSDNDGALTYYGKNGMISSTENTFADYTPQFAFAGKSGVSTPLTPAQQKNMFDFDWVYDDTTGNGVGFTIHPLQSSKRMDIVMTFYIARYNAYSAYEISEGEVTDNAIYYDYQKCEITFSIADTDTVRTFNPFGADGNSTIPLLDPNNQYNKYFSIAIQDVSTGVNRLGDFFNSYAKVTGLSGSFIGAMKKADIGFPDSDKVEKGHLKYYLSANDYGKYNNNYLYLYTDRDSDFVQVLKTDEGLIAGGSGIKASIETIVISVKLDVAINNATTADAIAAVNKAIATDFDNKYGLHDITYSEKDGAYYIGFMYEVIKLEAEDTTEGESAIEYGDNPVVTSYKTTRGHGASRNIQVKRYTVTAYGYTQDKSKGIVPDDDEEDDPLEEQEIASVFASPTLRIESYNGTELDIIGQKGATKKEDDKDVDITSYTVVDGNVLYVGDSRTINLTSFVKKIGNTIRFSYPNSAGTGDQASNFDGFNNQFTDDTITGGNVKVVELKADSVTVSPTTAVPLNFTVRIQRFADSGKTVRFENKDGSVDEIIYITFKFTNIVGFRMEPNSDAKLKYFITKKANDGDSVIDLLGTTTGVENQGRPFISVINANGGDLSTGAMTSLRNKAKIYKISTSEDKKSQALKLFTVKSLNDTSFAITPLMSGVGTLQFTANIFDQSRAFTLTINVSAKTELDRENYLVTINDSQNVYISTLLNVLNQTYSTFDTDDDDNSVNTNYNIIYADSANAIYYTDEKGDIATPEFISSTTIQEPDTTPYIYIQPSESIPDTSKKYFMHVRFTSNGNAKTYEEVTPDKLIEVIVPIESGRIKLQGEGGYLVANIDCRHTDKHADWVSISGSGLETKVTIKISDLLKLTSMSSPELYEILLVTATDGDTGLYFNYSFTKDKQSIVINPKLNTPDEKTYPINVTVYNRNNSFDTKVVSFDITVKGIISVLPVMEEDGLIGYGNIWLYSFLIVFGVLLIIFVIRYIIYVRRRSKQRAIIKRNQELIRMRDRMHGKANAATREQLVKSKLKMEDPKYAKMFNEMRKDKEDESGVALVNSDLAATAEKKDKKNKKKKGGKKTVAELKAELEAKKAAFAAAQAGGAQPVNPFATQMPVDGGFVPPDAGFVPPDGGFVPPDAGFVQDGGFAQPDAGFAAQDMGSDIVFDASDLGDGNM